MKIKKVVTFISGFVVGVVVLYSWGQIFNKQEAASNIKAITGDIEQFDTNTSKDIKVVDDNTADIEIVNNIQEVNTKDIKVDSQLAGETVLVREVNLQAGDSGGWIVVHEVDEGVIANALGAARRESGEYVDIKVYLLRSTIKGGTYAIVLYNDDGDKQFSLKTDSPLTDNDGKYVMSTFMTQ